jgi:aconitate hydratase
MAPDGAIVMADRSNISALAEYTFMKEDPEFVARAKRYGGGFIVGGENYGQGSSREHAALAPKYLGVCGVLAKSFARIHRRNLINHGIIPLVITDEIYKKIKIGDIITLPQIRKRLKGRAKFIVLKVGRKEYNIENTLNQREQDILIEGGILNWLKKQI